MNPATLQLWAVIGTWIASIGTVGAVITSLWLALYQTKIKLKVSAGHRLYITPGCNEPPDYCAIRVVNIGTRPAKITNVAWQVGNGKKKKQMVQIFGFSTFDDVPKILQEGEEANFMIPFTYPGNKDNWIITFPKCLVGKDSPRLIKSLKVIICTSVGQNFKCKAEDCLIEKLEESYEANKSINSNT